VTWVVRSIEEGKSGLTSILTVHQSTGMYGFDI